MIFKELWHISSTKSAILEKEGTNPDNQKLFIQSLYSLISTGTEKLVSSGQVPDEMHSLMKVPYMEGSFNLPVKYGYSLVGKVLEGPDDYKGKIVHLMHPHQNFVFAEPDDITLVPSEIPVHRATLLSNMETVINALWEGDISPGDKILICGFGIIGAMLAIISHQIPGVRVFVYEKDNLRVNIARSLGMEIFLSHETFDLAVNTSGSEEALQVCIDNTIQGGSILEMSWYGSQRITLFLGGKFHTRHQKIISSQVSEIPPHKAYKYNSKRRKDLGLTFLKNDIFDKLPFQIVPFDLLPDVFAELRTNPGKHFCTIAKYL